MGFSLEPEEVLRGVPFTEGIGAGNGGGGSGDTLSAPTSDGRLPGCDDDLLLGLL